MLPSEEKSALTMSETSSVKDIAAINEDIRTFSDFLEEHKDEETLSPTDQAELRQKFINLEPALQAMMSWPNDKVFETLRALLIKSFFWCDDDGCKIFHEACDKESKKSVTVLIVLYNVITNKIIPYLLADTGFCSSVSSTKSLNEIADYINDSIRFIKPDGLFSTALNWVDSFCKLSCELDTNYKLYLEFKEYASEKKKMDISAENFEKFMDDIYPLGPADY